MKIMKTDLLLLNNKVQNDGTENQNGTTASVITPEEPKNAMKALMFLGMRNLVSDPQLATQVGTIVEDEAAANDEEKNTKINFAEVPEDNEAASKVAFKGAKVNTRKFAALTAAAMMALSGVLTSCEKIYNTVPEGEHVNNITINIDLDNVTALIASMQSTLTQMLLQQQLSYEQFNKYMQQMEVWQNQVDSKLTSLENILKAMGDKIIDIDNGIQTNNAYQELILGILEQQMTRDEAVALLNQLIQEVKNGNKTLEEAMAELIAEAKLTNQNLSTIIGQLNDAYAQRQEEIELLKNIDKNTQETREQVQTANKNLIAINTTIMSNSKLILNAINKLDKDMQCSAAALAQQLGWSTYQVISYMQKLGIDLTNNATANKNDIVNAINTLLSATEQGNEELAAIKSDIEAGRGEATDYAQQMIEIMNRIDNTVTNIDQTLSQFVTDWAAARDALYAQINDLKDIAKNIYKEEKVQTSELKRLNKGVYSLKQSVDKDREYLKAIYDKIGSGTSLSAQELEEMFKRLNGNISGDLNDIKKLIAAELAKQDKQSAQLDAIYKKLSGLGCVSSAILNELQNIGDDLSGLDTISAKLDELIAAVQTLATSFNNYAKNAMNAYNQEIALLREIKCEIKNLGSKVSTLIMQGKKAEIQRTSIENAIKSLQTQVANLEAKLGHTITPEELDEILTNHDKENQEFYANLIKNSGLNEKDFDDVKNLLQQINTNLVTYQGEANATLDAILTKIKAMDKTAPDYTEKLNKIIELMENFKFECNCQGDCNNNDNIHEGIIDILG